MKYPSIIMLMLALAVNPALAHQEPVDNSGWWSDTWWEEGQLPPVESHAVVTRDTSYSNGKVEVPVYIARPQQKGQFPGVLFVHGRRGLDDLIKKHVRRLAARGFVVFAPDLYFGRDIAPYPILHDPVVVEDLNQGLNELLKLPDIRGKKVCTYSHTRGGYYTLQLAVTHNRQEKDIACYVSYYPHWQDPNAPEAMQVYGYAQETESLRIPALVFIGEEEQYQRRRVIETSVKFMQQKQRPVRLIVYPGVGRGFDFRPANVRTFADDLAAKDAILRATSFIRQHLQ